MRIPAHVHLQVHAPCVHVLMYVFVRARLVGARMRTTRSCAKSRHRK
jgi:hypothetical protein